jgi:FixJ family two-component response regulator
MPGMSGTQVNRALVAAGIQRPVVLITGRDDAARLSRSSGARYWLPKPFAVEQLFSTMERALADAAVT